MFSTVRQKWVGKEYDKQAAERISEALGLTGVISHILVNRGEDTPEKASEFLNPSLSKLYDPFLLKDMDKAKKRLEEAISRKEKIAVYGDYDVDGITGVTVIMKYLSLKGADAFYYIPDRFSEGYGLNEEAVRNIKNEGANLIITSDCGITATEEIKLAYSLGMEVIVTDHHKCPDELPKCEAVINPKRNDCSYPFRDLAGVGVSFKLITAMGEYEEIFDEILALTALGTVADIVPLTDENRIIVSFGLEKIREGACNGINALLEEACVDFNKADSRVLGYQLAPRINAAGRMGTPKKAVELFLSEKINETARIAGFLNNENIRRQNVEKEIHEEALAILKSDKEFENRDVIILSGDGWHNGVIGIVASKICEELGKPCVMISFDGDEGKGSLRSVKGFNIYEALLSLSPYLIKFGGHELAAGLSIKKENLEEFSEAFYKFASEKVSENKIQREISIDAEITEKELNLSFADSLSLLEPYGMGNPEPVFVLKNAKVRQSMDFKEGKHLRLSVLKRGVYLDAIGFSMGRYAGTLMPGDDIYIAGTVNINEYKDKKYLQMRIKDIRLV